MADTNAVAKINQSDLPAHLQGGKKSSFGNIDSTDLIIPRVKLLQAVSEEIQTFDGLKVGQFFHTLMEESMGTSLRFAPISLKKELVLWAPRGDDRGILARSSDCVRWDAGFENLEFTVKIKGAGDVTYNTRGSVKESKLADFGSSVPGDPNSRPAASLTYRMMFLFLDFLDWGPAIVINTRSSIRPAKGLISKVELRPQEHFDQVFTMGTTDEKGDEGPYKGYSYTAAGYTTAEEHELTKATYEKYGSLDWKANDELDEASTESGGSSRSNVSSEDVKNAKF